MKTIATSTWPETTLGALVEFHDHKRIPLSSAQRASRKGKYPYYGASGVIDHVDDYIFDGPYLLISEDGENLNSRKTPIAFRASGKFWVNNHSHIVRGRPNVVHDRFLEYLIAIADISGLVTGAAQPKLSQANLRIMKLRVPDFTTQKAILHVLSGYDDLIENNTRRIKILEDMAQMIYREWFVNFRFPGHEKVRMVESELGPIPEGWELKRLGDVAKVNDRSIKSSSAPDRIHYIDIASVSTARIEKIEPFNFGDAPGRARRIVRHGDIIWSTVRPNRRSYALIVTPEPNLIVSTGFAVLTAKTVPFSYLYYSVTTDEFADYLKNHATGSAYPAVTGKEFEQALLVIPSASLLNRFHEIAEPMLNLSWCLHKRNRNLRTTRDLLLPKLISGEVPVEAVDEAAAELLEQTA